MERPYSALFKAFHVNPFVVDLGLDDSLFRVYELVREAFERASGAGLGEDEFLTLIVGGKRVLSIAESIACEEAVRRGGAAPAFAGDEAARAHTFVSESPKRQCAHVVVGRRPLVGAD